MLGGGDDCRRGSAVLRHPGVDPWRLVARAPRTTSPRGAIVEGGSTITQQVAKLLLQRSVDGVEPRGLRAKVQRKVARAPARAPLHEARDPRALSESGAPTAIRLAGVARASRALLRRRAGDADAGAGGVSRRRCRSGPRRFNPLPRSRRAQARQRTVLAAWPAGDRSTPDQLREARGERLALVAASAAFSRAALRRDGARRGRRARGRRGSRRRSICELQREVEGHRRSSSGRRCVPTARKRRRRRARQRTRRMAGVGRLGRLLRRRARRRDQRSARAPRQPGSALKPFTYALAFEQGRTPATVLPDVPSHFPTAEAGVLYSPRNYDGRYRGPLLARRALAGSENVPAVALASELGVRTLLRFLTRAGFTTFDRNGVVLRPRRHARQRRGAPRPARRRVCGVRARRRSGSQPTVRQRARLRSSRKLTPSVSARGRPSGSPTSSPTPTRASSSSAAAATSSFRSRWP